MHWLRSHPYADALLAAGALLVIGVLIVRSHSSVAPRTSDLATWGGAGGVFVNGVAAPNPTAAANPTMTNANYGTQAVSYGYIPLAPGEDQPDAQGISGAFDFAAFAAALTQPMGSKNTQTTGDTASDAYSFIPSGLIATTTLVQTRSRQQDNLYLYGNDIGGTIQSFEYANPNQPAILKNFIEDRTNPDTQTAMKKLGNDLAAVGDSIGANSLIPTQAKSANQALAAGYRNIGTKLASIPDAQGDDGLITAIETYNSAAEDFVKKYVALALVFQSYGVVFSPGDGGAIFVFPDGGGL